MRTKVLSAALGVVIAVTPFAPLSAACGSRDESAAFHVRALQTELMVAALSCRGVGYDQRYAQFVQKFGPSLGTHGKALQTYFKKRYGGQGTTQLDRYVTSIANAASHRSMVDGGFCQGAAGLFDSVLRLERKDLASFSATLPFTDGPATQLACAGSSVTAKR